MRRHTRNHRTPAYRPKRHHTLQAARYRLALAVTALFACVCLGALLIPDNALFDRLLPFVAPPLTLVLNYYFGRRERE